MTVATWWLIISLVITFTIAITFTAILGLTALSWKIDFMLYQKRLQKENNIANTDLETQSTQPLPTRKAIWRKRKETQSCEGLLTTT